MDNKELVVSPKEKISLREKIRKFFNKTSRYADKKGHIHYIVYPPKKGFLEKKQDEIVELEINDVSNIGPEEKNALGQLSQLKKLILGKGVESISVEGTFPTIKTLVLSDDIKEIPKGAMDTIHSKRIIGSNFGVSIGKPVDSIFIDEVGRVNVCGSDNISKVNINPEHGVAYKVLEGSSKLSNSKSIYVYGHNENANGDYSVQVIIDDFPMSKENAEKIPNNRLIGILINGCQEVNLDELAQYPNLRQVFIGKSIERVKGTWNEKKRNWGMFHDSDKRAKYLAEYGYGLNVLSKDTTIINEGNYIKSEDAIKTNLQKDDKNVEERE